MMLATIAVLLLLQSEAVLETLASDPYVLVVIPGFGHNPVRAPILIQSLSLIQQSSVRTKCLLFNYEEPIDRNPDYDRSYFAENCEVMDYYFANYATYLKSVVPYLVNNSGFSHVFVLLDDVELFPSFNLTLALDIMQRNNLEVASPAIKGSLMWATKFHEYNHDDYRVGHQVVVIEVFATLFTRAGWDCFWTMLDPMLNAAGWGYEKTLHKFCLQRHAAFPMGVLDGMVAQHHKELGKVRVGFVPLGLSPLSPGKQRDQWRDLSATRRNISLEFSSHKIFGPALV